MSSCASSRNSLEGTSCSSFDPAAEESTSLNFEADTSARPMSKESGPCPGTPRPDSDLRNDHILVFLNIDWKIALTGLGDSGREFLNGHRFARNPLASNPAAVSITSTLGFAVIKIKLASGRKYFT